MSSQAAVWQAALPAGRSHHSSRLDAGMMTTTSRLDALKPFRLQNAIQCIVVGRTSICWLHANTPAPTPVMVSTARWLTQVC